MLLDSLSNSVHHDALTLQSALMLDRVARSCVERRTTSNRARSCQRQSRLGSVSAAVAVAVAEKCHTRHKDICVTTSTVAWAEAARVPFSVKRSSGVEALWRRALPWWGSVPAAAHEQSRSYLRVCPHSERHVLKKPAPLLYSCSLYAEN